MEVSDLRKGELDPDLTDSSDQESICSKSSETSSGLDPWDTVRNAELVTEPTEEGPNKAPCNGDLNDVSVGSSNLIAHIMSKAIKLSKF